MCFKTKTPAPEPIAKKPTREDEALKASNQTRNAAPSGFFANLFTSGMGDSSYAKNAAKLAKLGGQ